MRVGHDKLLTLQILHGHEGDVRLVISFSPLQDLPCIIFTYMVYTLFIGLWVHSIAKFTFIITIYNVLHMLYTCSFFSISSKTGFTQLPVLHSFCDWLIGHWWVAQTRSHLISVELSKVIFFLFYFTHLTVFNFSPLTDYFKKHLSGNLEMLSNI